MDITIQQFVEKIRRIIDFTNKIIRDETKSDCTPQKLLDVNRMTF
ncbi:MAG: hypothetical protein Q7U88_15880 [Desulfocapsaceae bacterium]|nr:hypothetical protein [Desulfocapsaceae bacterium]